MTEDATIPIALKDLTASERIFNEKVAALDRLYTALERFVDQKIDGLDRLYNGRMGALESAVDQRFAAAEIAVDKALAAVEKAITKAEAAQTSYNERSNEFRGQLDDQAKRLMPREEAQQLIGFTAVGLETTKKELANAKDDLKRDMQLIKEELRKDIQTLRESRAESTGAKEQSTAIRSQNNWIGSALIAGAGVLVAVSALIIAGIALATR